MILREWLNDDGSLKTLDEIKCLSEAWTAETWEEYLEYFDRSQKKPLLLLGSQVDEVSAESLRAEEDQRRVAGANGSAVTAYRP